MLCQSFLETDERANRAQHLWPYDRRSPPILRYLYALRFRRHAEELLAIWVSFRELWRAGNAGISVSTVLEVSSIHSSSAWEERVWESKKMASQTLCVMDGFIDPDKLVKDEDHLHLG